MGWRTWEVTAGGLDEADVAKLRAKGFTVSEGASQTETTWAPEQPREFHPTLWIVRVRASSGEDAIAQVVGALGREPPDLQVLDGD